MQVLQALLKRLYPTEHESVFHEIQVLVGIAHPQKRSALWYKNSVFYVVYPDSFLNEGKSGLKQISDKIPYLKKLGVGAIHILPLLSSPMIDAGFDISNYLIVRPELGGNTEFDSLLNRAKKERIHVLIDLVLNHISEKHEWFERAQNGELKYRNYFIYSATKPTLVQKFISTDGPFAEYELEGSTHTFRIIFPEFVGELPHWVQGRDELWYFHTFYPHQLDIDWNNPDVFIEFAKILIHWAKKGLSFRLDATIFLGKHIFKGEFDNPPNVHIFIKALHEILATVSPDSVFLAEAVDDLETIKEYFGDNTVTECELAYNFPLMNDLWVSMFTGNIESIWNNIFTAQKNLPTAAEWVNFLRNHDGFTLEFASEEISKLCLSHLITKNRGESFMAGFNIAGRTASFLDNDNSKILALYMLLASLPGSPAIMYGDEIAKINDYDFMKNKTAEKRIVAADNSIVDDLRDINRGQIDDNELVTENAKAVYEQMCNIFTTRNKYKKQFASNINRIEAPHGVFAASYDDSQQGVTLQIYVNFSSKIFTLEHLKGITALQIGTINSEGKKTIISPMSGIWIVN